MSSLFVYDLKFSDRVSVGIKSENRVTDMREAVPLNIFGHLPKYASEFLGGCIFKRGILHVDNEFGFFVFHN